MGKLVFITDTSFNSTKVRLKASPSDTRTRLSISFNSTKVRLKAADLSRADLSSAFQFYKSAIKSISFIHFIAFLFGFQFYKSAIKSIGTKDICMCSSKFQFYKSAIKSYNS